MAAFEEGGSKWEERLESDGVGVYYKSPDGKVFDDPPDDFVPPYVPDGEPLCPAGWQEKSGLDGKYYVDTSVTPNKIVKERPYRYGATYAPKKVAAHPAPAPAPKEVAPAPTPAPAPEPVVAKPAAEVEVDPATLDPDYVDPDPYKRPNITGWLLNAPTINHQQRVLNFDKNPKHTGNAKHEGDGENYATSHPDEVEKWWERALKLKAEGADFHKWGPHKAGETWYKEPPQP